MFCVLAPLHLCVTSTFRNLIIPQIRNPHSNESAIRNSFVPLCLGGYNNSVTLKGLLSSTVDRFRAAKPFNIPVALRAK